MSAFLADTLVWTGALLALVLLIRRPVAALFGPRAAYALWALPMARLLLPPLVLPAWLAPAEPMADPAVASAGQLVMDEHMVAMASNSEAVLAAQIEAAPSLLDTLMAFDWTSVLVPIWLIGAAVFLIRRYALYFKMRRELLEAARPMGEAGRVRLVETPAADGPVAFGVIDKVVALPMGFMAAPDRNARDLALAHELAHHRGLDLVCNMLVQPLFALHWFNPLSLLGWRALRRDQEAACDARVMASQPRESRAAYAAVIARFAVQPRHAARLALAAPMACPVLGDRSIVQRLKSLTMTDISARRRWSGRLLIAAAALALPLTGSISYAQSDPLPPPAPPATVTPPASASAPRPPEAPPSPEAPGLTLGGGGQAHFVRIDRRDPGDGKQHRIERHVIPHDGKVVRGHDMTAEERAEFDEEMPELRRELDRELGENGELQRELHRELGKHSEFQREMREKFGANGEFQRDIQLALADARANARAVALAAARAPKVTVRCRAGQTEVAETMGGKNGKQQIFVCNSLATAEARRALALARTEIARARELTNEQRAEALRSIDEAERETRAD